MVLLESILSLGILSGVPENSAPQYGFQYNGRHVQVHFMGRVGEKGLYRCASPRFDGCMIVQGPVSGEKPGEKDYLLAASNAFDELEMRTPTEPFRMEHVEVITVRNASDFIRVQQHFLGSRQKDDDPYY